MNLQPLITICGTTGVGKSNLAIELALHLTRGFPINRWKGARIINADSMQVYSGMDVITNKVPESERRGIEHLLIGFKEPGAQYVVGQWVQDALKKIEETHERNEIPIVVGGTAYWIQHLMFPNRLGLNNGTPDSEEPPARPLMSQGLADLVASLPPHLLALFDDLPGRPPSAAADPDVAFRLHALLSILDPPVAIRWHWRDTRKVLRSLCVIKESGRLASEILFDQSKDAASSKPRFRTLCLWLYAQPSVLERRLNERVDKMIQQGLINEIRSLRQIADAASMKLASLGSDAEVDSSRVTNDFTLGIYQSIGYKEFHDFLTTPSERAFNSAVEYMKVSTRQYAKRQISWLRNKLLPAAYAANTEQITTSTYLLDATELGEHWTARVQDPAINIVEEFLWGRELPDPTSLSDIARKMLTINQKPIDPTSVMNARRKLICPVCTMDTDRPFMVEEGSEWNAHQKTRLHKRLAMKVDQKLYDKDHQLKKQTERREKSNSTCDTADSTRLFVHDQ